MKKIYVNLKRFDIPSEFGGINKLAALEEWATAIVMQTANDINKLADKVECIMFFPESHISAAVKAKIKSNSGVEIGCQSVYRSDVSSNGNFGAFTTNRTAKSMKAYGTTTTIIGHCEERKDINEILRKGVILSQSLTNDKKYDEAINNEVSKLLNEQIKCAVSAGLKVLYCVGEKEEEIDQWENVIREQLRYGLKNVDLSQVTIAYEPVWAIGPGKIPPDDKYIRKIAKFIKDHVSDINVVYGGGLKEDNAEMLASIGEIDGGLIALTRFTGDIGFYPDEFIKIVKKYLN